MKVGFYHGAAGQNAVRAAAEAHAFQRENDTGERVSGGGAFDVIIACYSLFERDSADVKLHRKWLRSLRFSHLVLDEAHLVKNRNTQRAKRLDLVAARARRRVLLTGTPLQNNLRELESLIHLVLPGLLAEGALEGGIGQEGADETEAEAAARASRVKFILAPFILRRLKEEVARELIPKTHVKTIAEMTSGQRRSYESAVDAARAERRRQREGRGDGDSAGTNSSTNAPPSEKIKALFVHLRKIANHPLLVREKYTEEDVEEMSAVCHRKGAFGHEATLPMVRQHVRGLSDFALHQLCEDPQLGGALAHKALPAEAAFDASKTRKLETLLADLKSKGSRPLIFSQWKIVLDILEWALRERGHKFVRLDGSTAVEERQRICDAFNRGRQRHLRLLAVHARGRSRLEPHGRGRRRHPRLRLQPADRPPGGGPVASVGADQAGDGVSVGHERHRGRADRGDRGREARVGRGDIERPEGDGRGGEQGDAQHIGGLVRVTTRKFIGERANANAPL